MKITDTLYILDVSPLKEEALFTKWYDRMDDDRKKKIDAMKPVSGKLLSLGAGVLLNKAMEDVNAADYVVATGEHGKPYLKGRDDIFFNISHSGELVVLALSGREIGVDVEKNQHFKDRLIDYVFTEGDIALAKELGDTDECYTKLWTVKESIMKHSGLGISLEPKKIEILKDESSTGVFAARAEKYDCTGLKLFSLSEGEYQITVCSLGTEMPEVVHVDLT